MLTEFKLGLRKLVKFIIDQLIAFECSALTKNKRASKTVLIFRKDALGDYILFYPFLKYFRNYYRDYKITLVVPKIAFGLKDLLIPLSDEIIEFDAKKFSSNLFYRRRFIKTIAKAGFEIAIYPVYSRESVADLIMKLTKASKIIGFRNEEKSDYPYNITVSASEITSEIQRNAYFTSQCTGETVEIIFPSIELNNFRPAENARQLMKDYNLHEKTFAVIFPGSGAPYKKWPADRFAKVCDYLAKREIVPVICGAEYDRTISETIISIAETNQIVNLCGKTDISSLAHLLHSSIFYFGNDTGAVHLAAAIGTPAICILGGGHFGRFFPYGDLDKNIAVFDHDMSCLNDNWRCVKNLSPNEPAPCIAGVSVENCLSAIKKLTQE